MIGFAKNINHPKWTSRIITAGLMILGVAICPLGNPNILAQTLKDSDPALQKIDIIEHLGDTIPFDVILTDDKGRRVTLGEYFGDGKPVVLIMGYYTCPMLCNLVFNGVTQAAKELSWTPGDQYRILTVSIDPTEAFNLASAKKENYLTSLGRPEAADGWTFFAAAGDQSLRLADAVGFKYYYDEELQQYAHAAVITVLTDEGVVSRYLYGIEFNKRDFKMALLEASEGKIGNTIDRVLLYCFHYDPDAGAYTLFAANVMKLGGLLTLVFLVLFLGFFWIREIRRRSNSPTIQSQVKESR